MTNLPITPLNLQVSLADLYRALCLDSEVSFWLDSARDESPMSRFSYLGVASAGQVLQVDSALGTPNLWEELDAAVRSAPRISAEDAGFAGYPLGEVLDGGYVGFMGYEARASLGFEVTYQAETPDAFWIPATRFVAYEHATGRAWVVGDEEWTARAVSAASGSLDLLDLPEFPLAKLNFPLPDKSAYLAQIARSQQEIFEGNSYEVCLTAETSVSGMPVSHELLFDLYLKQRAYNPAPYAAFINGGDFFVLSSSPERFLSATADGVVESKPIKGTVPRGATPSEDEAAATWLANDPKTQAENLMIVDLLRNDLSIVCTPESVRVPVLMGVESYSTVHQLVSTIRGQLRPGRTAVEAASACFPGGSMTGAPKPSTMQIIDELEARARGIYSGFLGFFGASGAANLSIVIRTLVAHSDGTITLAAGGAIVADSDPVAEYDEMVTKLRAAVPPA